MSSTNYEETKKIVERSESAYSKEHFDNVPDRRGDGTAKYSKPPKGDPDRVIPMWVADMDFRAPACVEEALIGLAERGIYGYESKENGYEEAFCQWQEKRRGWKVDPKHVVRCGGVVYGIAQVIKAITEPGDGVLICQPVYYPFQMMIEQNGRVPVVSELLRGSDGIYHMDFDDLEAKLAEGSAKALLFCSPHNPVSRVWTREELEKLADICKRQGVTIISDEIHSDLVMPGNKAIPMATITEGTGVKTISLVAPSKTFNLAGLSASAIVCADEEVRKSIEKEIMATGGGGVNNAGVAATKAVYTSEEAENWLAALLEYLEGNYEYLRSEFPGRVIPMEGTYLAWLDFSDLGMEDKELDDWFLEECCLWFDRGGMFGKGGDGYTRINIACPRSTLTEAAARIKAALNTIEK